jgi:hypothetical protein
MMLPCMLASFACDDDMIPAATLRKLNEGDGSRRRSSFAERLGGAGEAASTRSSRRGSRASARVGVVS